MHIRFIGMSPKFCFRQPTIGTEWSIKLTRVVVVDLRQEKIDKVTAVDAKRAKMAATDLGKEM